MTKTFYLIRHGDKMRTAGDPPLSEKGLSQAQATALYLRSYPIQQIIASPILRTQQTAQFLANQLNLSVKTEPLLRERVNWGDGTSQSFEDFVAMWKKASLDRDWNPPVGDSSRVAGARLQRVVESHEENHENIVLITHGGIIADFVLNVFSEAELDNAFAGFLKTKENSISECSLTIIEYDAKNEQYQMKLLASVEHLRGV